MGAECVVQETMVDKLHRIKKLCEQGKSIVYDVNVRDLFIRIDVNADLVEDMLHAHFDMLHNQEEETLMPESMPRCPVCGGEMEPHAFHPPYTYFHCKANPNPGGPTRGLSPALKAMREHYRKSCVEVKL